MIMKTLFTYLCLYILVVVAVEPQPTKGTIIMYRKAELFGGSFKIKVNGQEALSLSTKVYTTISAPAGPIRIESSAYRSTTRILKFTVEAGKTYYIKASSEVDFMDSYLRMMVVQEAEAKADIGKYKFVPSKLP
jgi:hypothetical protein